MSHPPFLESQNIKLPKNGQILIYLNLKAEVSPNRQLLLFDTHAAQFFLHEKTGMKLTYTGQIAGKGDPASGDCSGVFLINDQPHKPLSLFGKLSIFFDGINLFSA